MITKLTILAVIFALLLTIPHTGCVEIANVPTTTPEEPVVPQVVAFPDENLEAVIRNALGKSEGEEILSTELDQLKKIDAPWDAGIKDLTGIENCENLAFLNLHKNPVVDVSPISSLTKLTHLDLCGEGIQISDISSLSSLTNLTFLAICNSQVSDISALASMRNLNVTDLVHNQISDLSPLSSLTELKILCLFHNEITDISPLSNLSNLVDLRLQHNLISDISPLLENEGLGEGDAVLLGGNPLDLTEGSEDMKNINILMERGVIVSLDPEDVWPKDIES